jgi:hypothetical protein
MKSYKSRTDNTVAKQKKKKTRPNNDPLTVHRTNNDPLTVHRTNNPFGIFTLFLNSTVKDSKYEQIKILI